MIGWIDSLLKLKPDSSADMEYLDSINDLINHPTVRSMKNYIQHGDIDCLEHCLYVPKTKHLRCDDHDQNNC